MKEPVTTRGKSPVGADSQQIVPTPDGVVQEAQNRRRRASRQVMLGRLLLVAVWLASWELASGRLVAEFWISRPSEIAKELWSWISSGLIVGHLLSTVQAMALGFAIGSVTAISTGFVLGRSPRLSRIMDPFITAVYSLPKIALAPLFILWFGIGMASKVALSALIVYFLVFYNTFNGVRSVDQDLLDTVALMGASRRQLLVRVILPSSAIWIFAGLQIAVPYALIGAVVGEIIASNQGLGFLLRRSTGTFNTSGTFAALAVLMVVALAVNMAVTRLGARTSRWRGAGASEDENAGVIL